MKNRCENKRILINNQIKKIYGIQYHMTETLKFLGLLKTTVSDALSIKFQVEVANNDSFLMHVCTLMLAEETSSA